MSKKKLQQISFEIMFLGILMVAIYIVFTTFLGIAVVQGESMYPTLQDGSIILLRKTIIEPQVNDIITISPYRYENEIIKRVIATEGDVVDIDFETGVITVNGKVIDEPYINEPTYRQYDIKFPVTVKKDCVFVLGDNRNESIDSRSTRIGQIPIEYIDGIYVNTIKY